MVVPAEHQKERGQSVGRENRPPLQTMQAMPAEDGFHALNAPIGEEAIAKALLTLNKYKQGKANLEARIIENQQWYKLRHWETMRSRKDDVQPVSGWLFNCICNKHADAMDNYPEPNVLPREENDKAEAEMLSSILPVLLDEINFEQVYDDVTLTKLQSGTGVYGVYWDGMALSNGMGEVSIKKVDVLNLYWEPGITDIQNSRNVFHVELRDNEALVEQYPQMVGKVGGQSISVAKYLYDDSVDTTEKSVVVDWYYKKMSPNGQQILHYVKFCNDVVLFATENEAQYKDTGLYAHGKYPFVFDTLFTVEGTPAGFGYIDVGKSAQEFVDRGNQAIMENMLVNATPRFFIRSDGAVNEEEYADWRKPFVHVDGTVNDSVLPVTGQLLSSTYVDVLLAKIDELKETTGNRDVNSGGASSGVTAASAVAMLQEAGSKLSRDSNKSTYRAFRQIILLVIELIRQFYDLPRCFRIIGENGTMRFVQYSNINIQQSEMNTRIPLFDIEVVAEKMSPYTKMSQNELALQFYQAGFFNPALAQQALMCLDMMDFRGKEDVLNKIAQNGTMLQQLMMMAQMLDKATGGTQFSEGVAQQYGTQPSGGGSKATGSDGGMTRANNAREETRSGTEVD